jgi:O-antigen ligase
VTRAGGIGAAVVRPWLGVAGRVALTATASAAAAMAAQFGPKRVVLIAAVGPPVAVVGWLLARRAGPRWCFAAFVIATALGSSKVSVAAGRINLRLTDAFYLALVGWAIVMLGRRQAARNDIGQRALAILLGVFGFSLVPILVAQPHDFFNPFVSWLRFVQTVSLVWLMPYLFDRDTDRQFVMGTVAGACGIELTRALIMAAAQGGALSARLQGGNGPDTEGLLAAVLLVTVLYGGVPQRRWLRRSLIVLALVCLALSRSVASIVAVGLVVGLAPLPGASSDRRAGLLRPARLLVMAVVVVVAIVGLRPQNLPGSQGFEKGSTAQRIVLGADGLLIFAHHPILGVGFGRSALPTVIADPRDTTVLRRWFATSPAAFIPDVSQCIGLNQATAAGPNSSCDIGTVHDAYIQVGAEAGMAGLLTLLGVGLIIAGKQRRLRKAVEDPHVRATLRWAVLLLVLVLLWWNDNPLFGAQPETVTVALALGTLAVPWRSRVGADPAVPRAPLQPVALMRGSA